jgi:hypothetical protein
LDVTAGLFASEQAAPPIQERLVEIDVNFAFRPVPIDVTAVMITTAIKPAIRPYSIAVAPDSF